jgi:cytochrome c oxidase subunit 2
VVLLSSCGRHVLPQDGIDAQGANARQLDNLARPVFAVAGIVFVFVQGLIIYCIVRFRARSADDAPVQVHGNARLEIGWTIVPAAILAIIGVFTVVTVFDINKKASGAEVVHVKVIGHQWWWEYQYPDLNIVTANELHIPVGKTVQLEMTSADVIHSFWPPKLAGKLDVVPGRTNYMKLEADHAGAYSGQCAEFCGLSHANMRLMVMADGADDWDAWVKNQQRPSVAAPTTTSTSTTTTAPVAGTPQTGTGGANASSTGTSSTAAATTADNAPKVGVDPVLDAAAGAGLFVTKGCSGCHTINGLAGANGKVGPNLTHLQARTRFAGAIFELNEKNLRRWLRDPPGMKPMNPTNGQGMPNLGLNEDEITQLIAYLETLK